MRELLEEQYHTFLLHTIDKLDMSGFQQRTRLKSVFPALAPDFLQFAFLTRLLRWFNTKKDVLHVHIGNIFSYSWNPVQKKKPLKLTSDEFQVSNSEYVEKQTWFCQTHNTTKKLARSNSDQLN